MRYFLILATFTWSVATHAQISGLETVTNHNAESLGFAFELTKVDAGARIRITVPATISNGFNYAYTGVQINNGDGELAMSIRPEAYDDFYSSSKFFQFVAPLEVLRCISVTGIYLNPDQPMHSDYLMKIDLASFLEDDIPSCTLARTTEPNK